MASDPRSNQISSRGSTGRRGSGFWREDRGRRCRRRCVREIRRSPCLGTGGERETTGWRGRRWGHPAIGGRRRRRRGWGGGRSEGRATATRTPDTPTTTTTTKRRETTRRRVYWSNADPPWEVEVEVVASEEEGERSNSLCIYIYICIYIDCIKICRERK